MNISCKSYFIIQIRKPWSWFCFGKQFDTIGFCWRSLGGFNISVYQLNANSSDTNKTFSVSVRNEESGEELSYSGKCLNLNINLNHVASMGRCLRISDETAKQFSVNDSLYIKYLIHDSSSLYKSNWFRILFSFYLFILFLYNFW